MKKFFLLILVFSSFGIYSEEKLGEPLSIRIYDEYYGEEESAPQEGDYSNVYPNYEERYILYDLNLYRLAPQILKNEDSNQAPDVKKCKDWGYCFQPVKPLYWNLNLSRAARYHNDDMIKNNCFAHNDCDGGDIWDRIQRYYTSGAMGENIAAGSKYNEVTKNFINEKGAPPGTTGHRENVFSSMFNEVGLGYSLGGAYGTYTTQDFGASAKFTHIPVAIHEPKNPNIKTNVKFKAIYYTSNKNTEHEIYLVLNGEKIKMNKNVSSDDWSEENYVGNDNVVTRNWFSAEYTVDFKIPKDCNRYYICVKEGDKEYSYPDEGALLVGSGCKGKLYDKERDEIKDKDGKKNDSETDGCSFNQGNKGALAVFVILIFLLSFFKKRFSLKDNI